MAFQRNVVEELLVSCHRYCCVCHKFCGSKIEIHHIVPRSEGGEDTFENAIALCFDCHAEIGAYNPKHPKGRKFSPSELRRHRDQWLKLCSSISPFRTIEGLPHITLTENDLEDFNAMFEKLRVDDPRLTLPLVRLLFLKGGEYPDRFFAFTIEKLSSANEEDRWKAAEIVKEFSHWNYPRVDIELLNQMAIDDFFGVRSVVATVLFDISRANPTAVPLETVYRLVLNDDWYVHTPALATLKSLSPTRPVALDLILELFRTGDDDHKDLALGALKDIGEVNPEVLSEETLEPLLHEGSQRSLATYQELKEKLKNLPKEKKQQYYPF